MPKTTSTGASSPDGPLQEPRTDYPQVELPAENMHSPEWWEAVSRLPAWDIEGES